MSAWLGTKKKNYELKKFLHMVPLSAMKYSCDGKVYLLMNENGIRVGYL
jgi:hypothetical protein